MNARGCLCGVFILIAVLTSSTRSWAAAEASTEAEFEFEYVTEENNPAELLILSPRLGRDRLGSVLTAYTQNSRIYLPLGAIAQMLELGIRLGKKNGTASGFIIDESRPFQLDALRLTVTYGQTQSRMDKSQIQIRPDDIYVDADLLRIWFPLDFQTNTFASTLEFVPREPMPITLRLEREARLNALQGSASGNLYPRLGNRYRLFDGPFVDQTIVVDAHKRPGAKAAMAAGFSTYLAADLLYLETTGYIAGTSLDGINDYRVAAGRKDYYGRLLGPLQAREFAVGDVYAESVPLVSGNQQVRGGYVGNFPLGRANDSEGHTFRGNLAVGWTVELYRDDLLLDYRRANESGTFVFEDVPLQLGVNHFALVFYGPYGQKREEHYDFNLADSFTPPGQVYYQVSGGEDPYGKGAGTVTAEFGVLPSLTMTSGFTTLQLESQAAQYASLGLRTFAGPVFGRTSVVTSSFGTSAMQAAAQTRVGLTNLTANYQILQPGFYSDVFPQSAVQLDNSTFVGSDTNLRFSNQIPLNISLSGMRSRYADSNVHWRLFNGLATSLQELAISNRLSWYRSTAFDDIRTDGSVALSRRVDPRGMVRVSGDFNYVVRPVAEATSFTVGVSGDLPYETVGTLSFHREFKGQSYTEGALSKEFRYFAASLRTRYTHPREIDGFLQMSTGFAYVQPTNEVHVSSRPLGNTGAALVRTFLDTNGNGKWDAGELPVANASVFVNGVASTGNASNGKGAEKIGTGRDGTLLLTRIPAYQPSDLTISSATLEDASWSSAVNGINIVARPGRVIVVDFPIIATGEIDGTVYLENLGNQMEQSGIKVELLTDDGKVYKTELSAYDGFYLFQKIPAGRYTLRVSPAQTVSLGLRKVAEKIVVVDASGSVLNGQDFNLVNQ